MSSADIHVFGHKNPDTDSICSSIALSKLLNLQNQKSVACRLGDLAPETEFVLNQFDAETPLLLKDARNSLGEIDLDSPIHLSPSMTMRKALEVLKENDRQSLAVVYSGKIEGMISLSDISKASLFDTAVSIELLQQTPVSNMAEAIEGRIIVQAEHPHINGKVSVIVLAENQTQNYEIRDRIVIAGNDSLAQEELIRNGAGMLVLVWTDYVSPYVQKVAREHNCSIIISGHGGMNTSRYLFLSSPISLIMKTEVVSLKSDDWIEDAFRKMTSSRFRSYPVLDKKNRLIGYAERFHLMNAKNKTVYMVDHNSFYQSVDGIEKANIAGVVDHHRISDFSTIRPVSFRNERLGCTCSIIYKMYQEAGFDPDWQTAGLMLSAILSDTLNFRSVTCTEQDRMIAQRLAEIAEVDLQDYAKLMFSSANPIQNLTPEDLLEYDCKSFTLSGIPIKIAQCIVYDSGPVKEMENVWLEVLSQRTRSSHENILLCFTCLIDKGSIFYWDGPEASRLQSSLNLEQGSFIPNVVSRKSQIVPWLEKSL